MQLIEENGDTYRKVTGPARFLHNNTYLLCDTALWNVKDSVLHCTGNVKLLQEETVLTSDKLTYLIAENLAQFRGSLVQLQDKDMNTLRTHNLDYNTKDSVAVFMEGGAMKDKDGQIIESLYGSYDSKTKIFTFFDNVEMVADTTFIKTTSLDYYGDTNIAVFGKGTDMWQDNDMLSADDGYYDRVDELFFFRNRVHGISGTKELWADTLYYHRLSSDIELMGHVQITDTVQRASALGGHMIYVDSLSMVTMMRNPALTGEVARDSSAVDTLWCRADTINYVSVPMCDVSEGFLDASNERLSALANDAVTAYRRRAAEDAAKRAEENAEYDPNRRPSDRQGADGGPPPSQQDGGGEDRRPPGEEMGEPPAGGHAPSKLDSLDAAIAALHAQVEESKKRLLERRAEEETQKLSEHEEEGEKEYADTTETQGEDLSSFEREGEDDFKMRADSLNFEFDSLGIDLDSLAFDSDSLYDAADSLVVRDSTAVGFLKAWGDVKIFKEDMQVICDSLEFCDLDSLARLYKNPVVWDHVVRQYVADSIICVIKDERLEKADLITNAFVAIQQDSLLFDQIRSAEMMAYFDSTSALVRYDALGTADVIFFLKEDSVYATVNKCNSKMLSAIFDGGELDHVYYFESVQNDAYPLAQLKKEDRVLKGFDWKPDKRPVNRYDITYQKLRDIQVEEYRAHPFPLFKETETYFPGYIFDLYEAIDRAKLAKALANQSPSSEDGGFDSIEPLDSLSTSLDSLPPAVDSLGAAIDSLMVGSDSISSGGGPAQSPFANRELSAKEQKRAAKEQAAAERAAEIARRQAEKEAKWARLDSLDAAKQAAKDSAALEKLRAKKLKALLKADAQAVRDSIQLQKYVEKYTKVKAIQDERAAKKAARRGLGSDDPENSGGSDDSVGQEGAENSNESLGSSGSSEGSEEHPGSSGSEENPEVEDSDDGISENLGEVSPGGDTGANDIYLDKTGTGDLETESGDLEKGSGGLETETGIEESLSPSLNEESETSVPKGGGLKILETKEEKMINTKSI